MADRRPDLEALEVNPGFNYLADKIFPALPVEGKTGKFYSQPQTVDVAAQTGRTVGDAPTKGQQTATPITFTVGERIRREATGDSEIELFGGLAKSEIRMTKVAKRAVLKSKEDAAVALSINNAALPTADILDSIRARLDTAVDAVHRFQGILAAFGGWTAMRRVTRFSEITDTLLRTGYAGQTAEDVRNVSPPTLATVLGVDSVEIGDDQFWPLDRILILKMPVADVEPAEEPQFGRRVQFIPDDMAELIMESYFDDDTIDWNVQARTWDEYKLLNATAGFVLTGIDEGNVITTTTTT